MKTYEIYSWDTDEKLGEIEASSIINAEIKASEKFDVASDRLYALSKE